ncbi:MAG: HEPN domain-containing protein [Mycobacteriales bacterium]
MAMVSSSDGESNELDCVVPVSENEWVRGFIRLPSSSDTGLLRLVEDIPGIEVGGELSTPLQFFIQDSGAGTPACVTDGFVIHHGVSMPIPAAFPLVIHINQAIVGTGEANEEHVQASAENAGLLNFFVSAQISQEQAATNSSVDVGRITAEFGKFELTVSEVTSREVDSTKLTADWSGRISLEGDALTLTDWTDLLVKALGLFSFCIDRPLIPERIFAPRSKGEIELHVGWRETAAPLSTVPLLTEQTLMTPITVVTEGWWALWQNAPHLLNHVNAFQLRRENLTLDDRLLVLARTLELFHAHTARMKSTIRTKAKQKEIRERVLASLPEDVADNADWIKKSLDESNRKRLATQIEDILDDLGPEVIGACGIQSTAEEFGGVVAATRNQFTHPKKHVPKRVPEGRDLVVLIHRMWFVVRACIMVELGLSREEIAQALERSSLKHYLING